MSDASICFLNVLLLLLYVFLHEEYKDSVSISASQLGGAAGLDRASRGPQ